MPKRRTLRVAPLALLLLPWIACDSKQSEVETNTATIRTLVSLPGEDELLRMEEERWSGNGRLKALLVDTNPKTRRRAAVALGRVADRSLEPELRRLLADKDNEVRAAAAWAGGQLGDAALAADLEGLFADPSPVVRRNALIARSLLAGTATPDGLTALLAGDADDEPARAALAAAARFDDPSLSPAIAARLTHASPEIRWRAAYALYRHGREGEALARTLSDSDARVRAYAALGVGSSGYSTALPELVNLLKDDSTDVVAAAATALGKLRDPGAAQPLIDLSTSDNPRRRIAAIHALAQGGISAPALTELFGHSDPWVRAMAIDGLRRMNASSALIGRAIKDRDWQVRAAAARALADAGNVSELAQTMQYDSDARVIPPVLEGLARLKYQGLDNVLLKHLTDKDAMVRATAARLMRGRRSETAVESLIRSFEMSKSDEILDARIAVLEAMAAAGGTEKALNILKLGAGDSNRLVRNRAWQLLQGLNATEGIEPPGRMTTLKTDNYYRDLASRGDYEYHATLETDHGTLVFRLHPREAPLTVRFLDEVAISKYYEDKTITWVSPPFELGDGDDRGDGYGHLGSFVSDEAHDLPFEKVHLTLARPLGRDSGNSQFRITLLPRPDLDGVATNVGELLSGAEVLEQLAPGSPIKRITVTTHEFKGKFEERKVEVPVAGTVPGDTGQAPVEAPGAWRRPASVLYLAVASGALFLFAVLPLLVSAERREDFPAALGLVVLLILIVSCGYTWLVMQGDYFSILTSPKPGPRILDRPNPPLMGRADAEQVCVAAMAWIMLNLGLMWFLVSGRSFARWLFLFLCFIEIALFTAQISTKLPLLYVISQVGIVINLLKIWFLLMDRQTKEYLAS